MFFNFLKRWVLKRTQVFFKNLESFNLILNVKINSSNNNNLYISNINSKSLNNISGLNNAVTPSSPVPNLGATANTSLVKYN